MSKSPNIFHWATKELSQDAFLCWLSSWANKEHSEANPELHEIGISFLQKCFQLHGLGLDSMAINTIEVRKQYFNIDVLIIINGIFAIIIEDKLNTEQHSDQLNRYKKLLMEENYNILIPIYYKPFEQSDTSIVRKSGYKYFSRNDMIQVLKNIKSYSDFGGMYLDRLCEIDEAITSYTSLPPSEWSTDSWRGFYGRLENDVVSPGWGFVNNPSGGFMGFWWHWHSDKNCSNYLQLEENKLCFKICVESDELRSELRHSWNELILKQSIGGKIKIRKPDRFGLGLYMTVAIFDTDYRVFENDKLDYETTLQNIKYAMNILSEINEKTPIDEAKSTKNA